MKARSLKSTTAVALVAGMLAALPAYAGSGLNTVTHANLSYKTLPKPTQTTVATVQPKVSQAKPEIQVAVMASSSSQPAARRSVFIHR